MSSIVPSGDSIRERVNDAQTADQWRDEARLMREAAMLGYGALKLVASVTALSYAQGAADVCERMESVLFPPEPEAEDPFCGPDPRAPNTKD